MALRRIFAVALVLAGIGAGVVTGAAGSSGTRQAIPTICPLAGDGSSATLPCCGPPRAASPAAPRGPAEADAPCPPRCDPVACPIPTVPNPTPPPTPLPTPQLKIPAKGLTVHHGRFKVTCTLNGGSGPCAVSARRSGHDIGTGSKVLASGHARVTVRLVVAGRAMLTRTSHHRMHARLTAVAGGRTSRVTALLHGR